MFFKSRKPFSVLPPSQPDQMVGEQTGGTVERHVSLDITGHYSLHFQTSFPNSTTYFLSPVNTAQSSVHHFNLLLSLKVPQITSCYMTPVQGTKRIFWSIRWCKTWQFITSEYFRRISCYIDRCNCQWRVNLKKKEHYFWNVHIPLCDSRHTEYLKQSNTWKKKQVCSCQWKLAAIFTTTFDPRHLV